jgi:hypothetical protein
MEPVATFSNPKTAAANRGDNNLRQEELVLVLDFVGQPTQLIAHRFHGADRVVENISSKPSSTIE